eukprot:TRINITY_DN61783_c0_g1_i1.p1 TRINITY_DN61783_c0_g1~~TRINITY_DN61783_c0_g1_i1.p1  ORF type:complete len:587 (-),score=100.85 TRINITY_DN61783_c0_g1_i1:94-1854(-)
MAEGQGCRDKLLTVLESSELEIIIGIIVICNLIVMILETDIQADCPEEEDCTPTWSKALNCVFLGVYTVECLLMVYAQGLKSFCSPWFRLDTGIVLSGYVELLVQILEVGNSQLLAMARMLRLGRIVRIARLFRAIPELYKLVTGFVTTVKAIFWGFICMILLLCMFAILTIAVVKPYRDKNSDDWCDIAFSRVSLTILYFFQTLIAGDSWGGCATPYILQGPELFFVFSASLFLISLGFTNLMLSVIVDASTDARERDKQARLQEELKEQRQALKEFHDMMAKVDRDGNGVISRDEIDHAFENNVGDLKEKLTSFGLDRTELNQLLEYHDTERNGDVDYTDFMHSLVRGHHSNEKTLIFAMKIQMDFVCHVLKRHFLSEPTSGRAGQSARESAIQPSTTDEKCSSPIPQVLTGTEAGHPLPPAPPQEDLQCIRIQMEAQNLSLSSRLDAKISEAAELVEFKDRIGESTRLRPPPSQKDRHNAAHTLQEDLHRITVQLEAQLLSLASDLQIQVARLADQKVKIYDCSDPLKSGDSLDQSLSSNCPLLSCASTADSLRFVVPRQIAPVSSNEQKSGQEQKQSSALRL